jgi:hypothetical protein
MAGSIINLAATFASRLIIDCAFVDIGAARIASRAAAANIMRNAFSARTDLFASQAGAADLAASALAFAAADISPTRRTAGRDAYFPVAINACLGRRGINRAYSIAEIGR